MCNRLGINCCCAPIESRIDEFNSRWQCWRSVTAGGASYLPLYERHEFTGGKLVRNDVSTDTATQFRNALAAKAVLWALPFSMEIVVEFDSIFNNGVAATELQFGVYNEWPGVGVNRAGYVRFQQMTGGGAGFGFIQAPGISASVVFSSSGALKVQTRFQFDVDGVTAWLWLNDTAPTFGSVFGSYSNGTKVTQSMPTGIQTRSDWFMGPWDTRSHPNPHTPRIESRCGSGTTR